MYPRKISDVHALHRERFRLKLQIKSLEEHGLLDLNPEFPPTSSIQGWMKWIRPMMGGKGWLDLALPIAAPLLSWITKGKRKRMGMEWAKQLATVAGLWLALRYLKKKMRKN